MAGATMEMNIEAFRCYRPQPGDVLIVKPELGKRLLPKYADEIRDLLKQHLPEFVKVLVLNEGVDLEIVRNGEQPCEAAN